MQMKTAICLFIAILVLTGCGTRETVLDRVVDIPDGVVLEIPDVPSLCDQMGFEGRYIEVNGTHLYVEREGSGIPVVLLHGGPGATHHYFHPHFSRAAEFAEVIYYDQRGCGLSGYDRGGKGYSVGQAADDLEALRVALGHETWVIAGHSYGGLLAQVYAHRYPGSVSGLVLICSAICISLYDELEGSRQFDYLTLEERLLINRIAEADSLNPAQRLFNRHLAGDWKRQSFFRPAEEDLARMVLYEWVQDPIFRSEVLRDFWRFEPDGTIEEFSIPVLVVEAEWDLTWSAEKAFLLRDQYPSCSFVMIPDAGHSPFADRPDEFMQALREFCDSL